MRVPLLGRADVRNLFVPFFGREQVAGCRMEGSLKVTKS